jgi:hypothetical protein
MLKMRAPAGTKSCSWQGETFVVTESGTIVVPEAAVRDLEPHGFTKLEEAPAQVTSNTLQLKKRA